MSPSVAYVVLATISDILDKSIPSSGLRPREGVAIKDTVTMMSARRWLVEHVPMDWDRGEPYEPRSKYYFRMV